MSISLYCNPLFRRMWPTSRPMWGQTPPLVTPPSAPGCWGRAQATPASPPTTSWPPPRGWPPYTGHCWGQPARAQRVRWHPRISLPVVTCHHYRPGLRRTRRGPERQAEARSSALTSCSGKMTRGQSSRRTPRASLWARWSPGTARRTRWTWAARRSPSRRRWRARRQQVNMIN